MEMSLVSHSSNFEFLLIKLSFIYKTTRMILEHSYPIIYPLCDIFIYFEKVLNSFNFLNVEWLNKNVSEIKKIYMLDNYRIQALHLHRIRMNYINVMKRIYLT